MPADTRAHDGGEERARLLAFEVHVEPVKREAPLLSCEQDPEAVADPEVAQLASSCQFVLPSGPAQSGRLVHLHTIHCWTA
jgi:hypothetical protein